MASMLQTVLQFELYHPLVAFMRLEAVWILVNWFYLGEEDIKLVFSPGRENDS